MCSVLHISVFFLLGQLASGFYIQPDVLFFSEHPSSQLLVANSDLYLSCSVQLKSISDEEGGLTAPVVEWTVDGANISEVFPEAVVSQEVSLSHNLHSTLHIRHTSHLHTGTYRCRTVDGTDEYKMRSTQRGPGDLCTNHPCKPFITASNPAMVTVIENSTRTQVVELHRCSSLILPCGSLLPGQGLRPVLEWQRGGVTINSSTIYHILPTGDLAVFHSTEEEVADTYHCVALSEPSSVTIATYMVIEGSDQDHDSTSLRLVSSSQSSTLAEGDSVELFLSAAGICTDHLYCVWRRNESLLCPAGSGNGSAGMGDRSQSETKHECGEHRLQIHSVSHTEDSGEYCCEMVVSVGGGLMGTVCLDVEVTRAAPPHLSSPQNDTTITLNATLPANLTLHCTTHPDTPTPTHHWYYNGEEITEDTRTGSGSGCDDCTFFFEEGGSLVVESEEGESVVGVYQCFAGNRFGYSVVTLRVLLEGVTNPPGIPILHEIPRPNQDPYDIPFRISWSPPSYPETLHHVKYSLHTGNAPILTETNSGEDFFRLYGYAYIYMLVVDADSGEELSERSPYYWGLTEGDCYRHVLFPPKLNTNCTEGVAAVRWVNSPENYEVYDTDVFDPEPGLYHINITCYLHDGSIQQTNEVFQSEGNTIVDGEIPLGTTCEFRGAATPQNGDVHCLDPAAIQYNVTSCQVETYVEVENSTYVVAEGEGSLEVCLTAKGYNFSFELTSTYSNTSEVTRELYVSTAGEKVCVEVDIEDNAAVEEERNITLRLSSTSHGVDVGPPATITILDNDVLPVFFTQPSWEVEEGNSVTVCAATDGELRRTVNLFLTSEDVMAIGGSDYEPLYTRHQLTLDINSANSCVSFSAPDNAVVDSDKDFKVILESSDPAVNVTTQQAVVNIRDDDKISVGFNQTSYTVTLEAVTDTCMYVIASGYLSRELAVNLSVDQDLDDDQRVQLSHKELMFNSSPDTICVHLNITRIDRTVMVNLTLEKEPQERAIRWTNQSATVKILPQTSEENNYIIVIVVPAVLLVMILVLGCLVVTLVVKVAREKTKRWHEIPTEPYNRNKSLPNLRKIELHPDNNSICESLYTERATATDVTRQDDRSLLSVSEPTDPSGQVTPVHSVSRSINNSNNSNHSTCRNTSDPNNSTHSMSRHTSDSNSSNTSDSSHHDYIVDLRVGWPVISNQGSAASTGQAQNPKDSMALFSEVFSILAKTQPDSGLGMDEH